MDRHQNASIVMGDVVNPSYFARHSSKLYRTFRVDLKNRHELMYGCVLTMTPTVVRSIDRHRGWDRSF